MRKAGITVWALLAAASAGPALAQERAPARADQWQKVIECRKETDPAQRLACMDAAIAAVERAEANRELVVIDRRQTELQARDDFGQRKPEEQLARALPRPKVREVRSTVTASRLRAYSRGWLIALADGSVWEQIDREEVYRTPKPGLSAHITRGLLGSFFLVLDGSTAMRVRRID